MSTFSDTSPIIIKKRKGTSEEPYKPITENLNVEYNIGILNEIPDDFKRVQIEDMFEKRTNYYDGNCKIKENEYIVDYKLGFIYFNEKMNKKTVKVNYLGTGIVLYPASRIYDTGKKDVIVTIQEMIDGGRKAIETYSNISNAIEAAKEYYIKLTTSTQLAKEQDDTLNITIVKGNEINNLLKENINKATEINNTLNGNIENGKNKITEITEKQNEIDENEKARVQSEKERISNEINRKSNENTRIQEEDKRVENESARQTNENLRKNNENKRQNNETIRVQEEKNRVEEWNLIKNNYLDNNLGDMKKLVYDKNNNGIVDIAEVAKEVDWNNITNKPDLLKVSKLQSINKKEPDDTGNVTITAKDINMDDNRNIEENMQNNIDKLKVLTQDVDDFKQNIKTQLNEKITKIYVDNALEKKQDVLPIERKRKITFGISEPSGGEDGDIYFQYEE